MALLNQGGAQGLERVWRAGRLLCLIALCCVVLPLKVRSATSEYDLKAAFLYHFTQFVEWPENAFAGTNSPLVIGILGTNPFGETLENLVQGEQIRGRPLVVRRYATALAAREAHVLFISRSEEDEWPAIQRIVGDRPILTVSETEGFVRNGGMVRFFTRENKVRLQIHHENARRAGLVVSSKLLRVAEVVGTE